ncbi:HU family DNA-binding protein [Candidatus Gracilibacteria bacterium]|nr:HU family DNA-binding protein [Candidatus Gracilibacteria bacterium]MCF7856283.1 HU family DNA-binding protein [Candidatus Gracilibacteria bacterium]MCF7896238.1 HU family DNA-binding protein [Candidatus Gracilibacteria bacterium]
MAKALTQAQIVADIAEAAGISKKEAKTALEALATALVKNDKVATPFGIFSKKVKPARPARKGTNPFTGEEMMFKAKPKQIVLKYRPNKATKDALN